MNCGYVARLCREVAEFTSDYTADDWRLIVHYLTSMIDVLHRQTRWLSEIDDGNDEGG